MTPFVRSRSKRRLGTSSTSSSSSTSSTSSSSPSNDDDDDEEEEEEQVVVVEGRSRQHYRHTLASRPNAHGCRVGTAGLIGEATSCHRRCGLEGRRTGGGGKFEARAGTGPLAVPPERRHCDFFAVVQNQTARYNSRWHRIPVASGGTSSRGLIQAAGEENEGQGEKNCVACKE